MNHWFLIHCCFVFCTIKHFTCCNFLLVRESIQLNSFTIRNFFGLRYCSAVPFLSNSLRISLVNCNLFIDGTHVPLAVCVWRCTFCFSGGAICSSGTTSFNTNSVIRSSSCGCKRNWWQTFTFSLHKRRFIGIKICQDEYHKGVEECKNALRARLTLSKGDKPYSARDLSNKIGKLWTTTAGWKIVPLGKGYYDFHFDSADNLRKIWAAGTVNLKPGLLRLSQWTKDFKYLAQK